MGGNASGLTDLDDQALLNAFRVAADLVLVGAATARAEDYGPVVLPEQVGRSRVESGRTAVPRLVILTRHLDLDPGARFLGSELPPLILTGTDHRPQVRRLLEGRAEIVVFDEPLVDLSAMLETLADARFILCEGGPSINGQLAEGDLIHEVNITTAPVMVGGDPRGWLTPRQS